MIQTDPNTMLLYFSDLMLQLLSLYMELGEQRDPVRDLTKQGSCDETRCTLSSSLHRFITYHVSFGPRAVCLTPHQSPLSVSLSQF
jgi:hypothetical protein